MSAPVQALFAPFRLGNLELPTRVVMAPMTRSFSPGGVPNAKVIEYYRRRAAAGVGLIVTEGTTVGHKAANGYPNVPRFYGEDALAGQGAHGVALAGKQENAHGLTPFWPSAFPSCACAAAGVAAAWENPMPISRK